MNFSQLLPVGFHASSWRLRYAPLLFLLLQVFDFLITMVQFLDGTDEETRVTEMHFLGDTNVAASGLTTAAQSSLCAQVQTWKDSFMSKECHSISVEETFQKWWGGACTPRPVAAGIGFRLKTSKTQALPNSKFDKGAGGPSRSSVFGSEHVLFAVRCFPSLSDSLEQLDCGNKSFPLTADHVPISRKNLRDFLEAFLGSLWTLNCYLLLPINAIYSIYSCFRMLAGLALNCFEIPRFLSLQLVLHFLHLLQFCLNLEPSGYSLVAPWK